MKWAVSIFKFFASLRLAVFLLVVLGAIFGVGTFIESYHGTPAAQVLIYRTKWLGMLMLLLALNLLASALDRLPWKKKHIGFLTTHLGIILMLAGSLITQAFGIEGQVQIEEGRTESRMTLTEPIVHFVNTNSEEKWTFDFKSHVFPWSGKERIHTQFAAPFHLFLTHDYPKAKRSEVVKEAKSGDPALHVSLKGSMANVDEWLVLGNPSKESIELGPASIRFSKERLELPDPKKNKNQNPSLKFDFDSGEAIQIPVDEKRIGKKLNLEETPFAITINQIFKDAVVEGNQLIERAQTNESLKNPAIQLTLEGNGISEKHTIFAKYPEFPTLHGMKPSEARVRIAYEIPQLSSQTSKNEVRFIYSASKLEYQVKKGNEIKEGEVEIGKEIETGWMDFKFVVDSYYPKAEIEEQFEPLPNLSEHLEAIPTIRVSLEKESETKTLWLTQGELYTFTFQHADYHVIYGLRTKPLGFQVELIDFMMDKDPGTDRPASFKSSVKLKDPMKGIEREHLIQMNQPLKYRGYKLYQSAYHLEPGKPDMSIFTAAKDPGNPYKYAGAIIMIGGIIMLFYTKRFSTLKGSDPKLRTK